MKWSGLDSASIKLLMRDLAINKISDQGRDQAEACLEELLELREKYQHLLQVHANLVNEPYRFPRAGEKYNDGLPPGWPKRNPGEKL